MRFSRRTAALLCLGLTAAACSSPAEEGSPQTPSDAADATASSSTPQQDGGGSGTPVSPSETRAGSPSASCVDRLVGDLTPKQRVGQLIMVGLQAGTPTSAVTGLIRDQHVGNVIYLGGWEGSSEITRTSRALQQQVNAESTGGLRLFVAADQEGGQVWQIRGTGTPPLPSALEQGRASESRRTSYGKQIGALLTKVGVNLNLAPVADTVSPELGTANEPIGKWGRQYANDPDQVASAVPDIITGLHDGGVAATVKHFPGIGRIRGNTDFTAQDIVDSETTRTDSYLDPFRAGIKAGADMVMMSSARYPQIDGDAPALFSSTVVQDLLRKDLGFGGVVITDDVAAAALEETPPGERATRFVGAGGDILLTGDASEVQPMIRALTTKAKQDPAFQKQIDASVRRVVALKVERGLADCG